MLIPFCYMMISDFIAYLHERHVFPVRGHYCFRLIFSFAFPLCSTLYILSMTFDRCYSILRPHKAAIVNTVKRAKITIAIIPVFSILFNIPQYFLSQSTGTNCIPYGNSSEFKYSEIYYWISFLIIFGFPFLLLLIMNSFIIVTLRKRFSNFRSIKSQNIGQGQKQGQGQNQGQDHEQGKGQNADKTGSSEMHVYVILLLITGSFLILTTPGTIVLLYVVHVNIGTSPENYATFFFAETFTEKLFYTSCGINFFLYVLSGKKFRKDLVSLFVCKNSDKNDIYFMSGSVHTVSSHVRE